MQSYTPSTSTFSDHISVVESVDAVSSENANAAVKQLIENDIVIKESVDLLIQNSLKVSDVSGASAVSTAGTRSVTIKWSDPTDTVVGDVTIAEWAGTILVRKAGSAPTSPTDGTQLVDNTVRNNYSSSGYVDSNLDYGTTYYYRFFPYTTLGAITLGTAVNISPVRETLAVPTPAASLTYTGSEQTMTFANYNPDKMTVTGDSATNAGSHDAVFTLLPGYAWSDNSMTPKTVTWSMAKVAGSISLSKNTSSLDADHLTDAITFTATGEVTVISSDNNNVTAAVSGNAINLTCVGTTTETVTITVNVAASTNYEATSAIITVDVLFVSTTLDDNDWDLISKISGDGLASSYWSVGDAKAVLVNGTVGTLSINQTLYVFILGFNHNSAIEGSGISFGCFKTAKTGGTDVCLCDASYNSNKSDGSKVFNMNHWGGSSNPYNTNYGGWKGCDARYDILGSVDSAPSGYGSTPQTNRTGNDASATTATNPVSNTLMAALPAALRAVMKPITKYTDNKGNSSNAAANVTASVDYLPLLSEFEVQGARSYANENEKNQQAQYAYYANANSKIKYQHGNTGSAALWWCRSAYSSDATTFCAVNTDGGAYGTYSRSSYGLAPAFLV